MSALTSSNYSLFRCLQTLFLQILGEVESLLVPCLKENLCSKAVIRKTLIMQVVKYMFIYSSIAILKQLIVSLLTTCLAVNFFCILKNIQVSQDHETMAQVLFSRNLRLNVALTFWRRRSISELVAYLLR